MRCFLRNRAARVFAASGVGCKDLGGRTRSGTGRMRASRSINAFCTLSVPGTGAVDSAGTLGFGSVML